MSTPSSPNPKQRNPGPKLSAQSPLDIGAELQLTLATSRMTQNICTSKSSFQTEKSVLQPSGLATNTQLAEQRLRSIARVTTSEKLSEYIKEFYRGSLDGIQISVDPDSDARKDVTTPARAFKFHPFYFSIGIIFPFSDFQRDFLSFYNYAPCQWTPESYRLVLAFERLNEWYNIGMRLNEFRALFRVTCQATLRQYMSFHATGRWTVHPFVDSVKTDRDWSLDVITVSGEWEDPNQKFPISINWKHSINEDGFNKVDVVRVDLIDAFYSIPEKFRQLEWVINTCYDRPENRDWVVPFHGLGNNPVVASSDELKAIYDEHLVSLGKKKAKLKKGSGNAITWPVEAKDKSRKRTVDGQTPNGVVKKSKHVSRQGSTSKSNSPERTSDNADIVTIHSEKVTERVSTVHYEEEHNIDSDLLNIGEDNVPHIRSIKEGYAAEVWTDSIFSPFDANMWISQSVDSLRDDVFLGWYQTFGRTKTLLYKFDNLRKEAQKGWQDEKEKNIGLLAKNGDLERELADIKDRFDGMRDNLQNEIAGARFGIECKTNQLTRLKQESADLVATHQKQLQTLKNQHEAQLIDMEEEKCAAVEKVRKSLMNELVRITDGEDSDGTDEAS